MKKIIFSFLFCLCALVITSQRSAFFIAEDKLFYEGKAFFEDCNYAGCMDKLSEYLKFSTDKNLMREAEYLIVASGYRQGKEGIEDMLIAYLEKYPETLYRDEIRFMTGSVYFAENDFQKAFLWLNSVEIDNLSKKDQEDYAYRMAFSSYRMGNTEDAFRLFGLLRDNSPKYRLYATYYLASIYYQQQDYEQAYPLFNSLKNEPEFLPEVSYYMLQIDFARGNYSQVIREGTTFLSNYPGNKNNPALNRILGLSYYEEGDYNQAGNYLENFINASPEEYISHRDYYIAGLAYYNQNRFDKAIQYLGESISTEDEMGQNANLFLGQAYLQTGNQNNALLAFEAASSVDYNPEIKEAAMYNYAVLLHQTSRSAFGESVTVLENFLNQYPNSIYADRVNDLLVEVYLTTKNYDVALKSIEKIRNPGRKILEAKQKIYYYLGTVAYTNTKYEDAINYFSQSINMTDYAPEEKRKSLFWRGESYYRKNQFDNAIKDYNSYIASSSTSNELHIQSYYNLGYSYFNKQQYSHALQSFNRYVGLENNRTKATMGDAYARLGDCYFEQRNFTAAENAYAQSANLQPGMADYTIYQKGFVLGLQKNYRGKIEQMDLVIRNYPDSRYVPDALFEKGRSYVMLENEAAAIETFTILWDKYRDNPLARKAGLQIGLLYFNTNRPQQAATAYKNVISRYPGSEEAKVAVQDLKSVYVDLNNIEEYAQYVNSLGGSAKFETSEQDSLTYLAAERFFTRGDTNQAQDALRKYIQNFPNGAFTVKANYYLGNTYHNQGNTAQAKEAYQKVLDAGNNDFTEETLIRLAEIQYSEKEYAGAFTTYERLANVSGTKAGKETGLLGVIRTGALLNKNTEVINGATTLLKEQNLSPELQTEAKYSLAKAYLNVNEPTQAASYLTDISKDTRTAFGAEAKYLLARYYFENNQKEKAETEIMDYIRTGTPHAYWLARSFILLSDIYISNDDSLQARQYLESLKQNYTTQDDIQQMINERLEKLNQ